MSGKEKSTKVGDTTLVTRDDGTASWENRADKGGEPSDKK